MKTFYSRNKIKLSKVIQKRLKEIMELWTTVLSKKSINPIPGYSGTSCTSTVIQAGWQVRCALRDTMAGPKSQPPFILSPFSIHWKPLQAKIIWKKLPLCITPRTVKNVPPETRWSRSNKIFAEVQDVITRGKEVPMTTGRERKWVKSWGFKSLTIPGNTNLYLEICLWDWNPR